MRYNVQKQSKQTAAEIINTWPPKEIEKILKEYGEETGLKLKETHDLYVHRSLTREILVFKH